ncbi:sulfite exporter TauE/SafE family protein [Sulfoacidibacillus ferrooxidans]|uniref:Probable membrane transporter protein n=1 Tax=Sulfoacidibacillus ferrooxidans TaxID=2005001 RepID=A0A9X2ACM6_9BACL|nr:sulfite exporter TauE/SafE family protein [Sulfoacidibacillus ferrooxidans]MCI0182470.1 hypothetical protein [Sulfoacidibacillus ferrooxidans]
MLVYATSLIFIVSALFAMLGMGGGMLHVPILLWFGYPLKTVAQPIGILLNGLTTLVALITYARNKLVDWRGSWPMSLAALILAPLGSIVAHRVDDQLLIFLLVLMIFFASIRTLISAKKIEPKAYTLTTKHRLIGIFVAGIAAFVGAMLGLGGGTFISPLLMWLGYPTKRAVGTSAFIVTLSSASGFVARIGHVDTSWVTICVLSVAVIVAAFIGSTLMAKKAKPQWVKYAYSVLLIGVGIKLLLPIM